ICRVCVPTVPAGWVAVSSAGVTVMTGMSSTDSVAGTGVTGLTGSLDSRHSVASSTSPTVRPVESKVTSTVCDPPGATEPDSADIENHGVSCGASQLVWATPVTLMTMWKPGNPIAAVSTGSGSPQEADRR